MEISPIIPGADNIFPGLPHAGTGRCLDAGENELDGTPFNDQAMWAADHPYSRTDSEGNSISDKYEWATHNNCKPEELLVGVTVDTDHFNWMETSRGKQSNWTAVRNIIPVCVRTNKDLTWVGDPIEERNSDVFATGFVRLRCPKDSYVKRISGTYTDALSPEANFLNSLQLECSNSELTTTAGGFDPTTSSISAKTFNLECLSWRFLPMGTAFNKKDYGLGGPSKLKLSNVPPSGVGIVRNLVLDCGDAERIKNGPPPGEIACSKYMKNWLLTYHASGRWTEEPIRDRDLLELCGGVASQDEAARRIWCYSEMMGAGSNGASRWAVMECNKFSFKEPTPWPHPGVVDLKKRWRSPIFDTSVPLTWPPPADPRWSTKRNPASLPATPPAPKLTGGGVRLGTLPGEIACNTYMNERKVPEQGGDPRPIQEAERMELCKGAADEKEAALRVWCFGALIAQGNSPSSATFNCGHGNGPALGNNPVPTWPPPEPAAWARTPIPTPTPTPTPTTSAPPVVPVNDPVPTTPQPGVPPTAPAVATCDAGKENLCRSLIQDQVPWSTAKGDTYTLRHWDPRNLDKLCGCTADAATTVQCFQNALYSNGNSWIAAIDSCKATNDPAPIAPMAAPVEAKCDTAKENSCQSLVQGQVPWTTAASEDPGIRHWQPINLENLCRCTKDAAATVLCFQNALVKNGNSWMAAIDSCKVR